MASEGRLLLVRRALEPWRGRWCAPGGFCDVDEHPIDTAAREALEETGVPVRITGFLGIWVSGYDERDAVSVAYYHAVPDGELGTPDAEEVSEVRWFSPDELPNELAPPGTFERVLDAWRAAVAAGETTTPLRDR